MKHQSWKINELIGVFVGVIIILAILLGIVHYVKGGNVSLVTYTDVRNLYSIQLPASWVGFSASDGEKYAIKNVEDGTFGEPDGYDHIMLESFSDKYATKEKNASWHDLVSSIRLFDKYNLVTKKTIGGVTEYEYTLKPGISDGLKFYFLSERSDIAVLVGSDKDDQVVRNVASSVSFLK